MSSVKNICNPGNSDGSLPRSSDTLHVDTLEISKEIKEKIDEMVDSVQKKELDAEASKSPSPISVADQMVSMLWASASSPTKNSMNGRCSPKEVVDENIILESNHVFLREESESYEDVEEITIQDQNEGNDAISRDDLFDEIIEVITVEDSHESDIDISLDTDDEYSGSKEFIEVEILHNVEEYDDNSFDEITADDSEYDEKTIEEDLQRDHELRDIECEKVHEGKEEVLIHGSFCQSHTSAREDACSFDCKVPKMLNLPENDLNQSLAFDKHSQKALKPTSPTISMTIASQKRISIDGHHLSSNVEIGKPRIPRSPSVGAKFAEKLKMFDSPKSFPPQGAPLISDQSYKTLAERNVPAEASFEDSKMNTKVIEGHVHKISESNPIFEPRSKTMNRMDEALQKVSAEKETDEALVDEIVSLVKEPGAMKNKQELAERITCLLSAQSKISSKMSTIKAIERIETQMPTMNLSVDATSSKPVKSLIPQGKFARRASLYLDERKEKDSDPGLEAMRKNAKMHHEVPKHVIDRGVAGNRGIRQPSSADSKQESIGKQKMKPLSEVGKKAVNPEEIMARIWSKTPDPHKSTPKVYSVASESLESTTTQTHDITTPRKLGDKLKMFEGQNSSGPCKKIHLGPRLDSSDEMLNVDQETIRRISTFQRLWKLKNSGRTTVRVSTTKAISTVSTDRKSCTDRVTRSRSVHTSINSLDGTDQDSNPGTEAAPDRGSTIFHSNACQNYSLEDFEKGNFDRSVVDMERWEEFLSDENFYEQFGQTKTDFFGQPKWKRDKQKRSIRVAF